MKTVMRFCVGGPPMNIGACAPDFVIGRGMFPSRAYYRVGFDSAIDYSECFTLVRFAGTQNTITATFLTPLEEKITVCVGAPEYEVDHALVMLIDGVVMTRDCVKTAWFEAEGGFALTCA